MELVRGIIMKIHWTSYVAYFLLLFYQYFCTSKYMYYGHKQSGRVSDDFIIRFHCTLLYISFFYFYCTNICNNQYFCILFTVMSNRSYYDGDLKYSEKWANYSFMCSMLTIGISIIVYIAIGFSMSEMGYRGGQSY